MIKHVTLGLSSSCTPLLPVRAHLHVHTYNLAVLVRFFRRLAKYKKEKSDLPGVLID